MFDSSAGGQTRQRAAIALVILLLAALVPNVRPAAAAPGDPSVRADATADVARGGTLFTVDLVDMNLPPADNYIVVQVFRDGVAISLGPYGMLELSCPAPTGPVADGVTNQCSFLAREVVTAGLYDIQIGVSYAPVNGEYSASVTVTDDIEPWWNDVTIIHRSADLFTGFTTIAVTVDAVPAVVDAIDLSYFFDSDSDGMADALAHTLVCVDDPVGPVGDTRVVRCDTTGIGIEPRCAEDHISGQSCIVDPRYTARLNGIDVAALSYDGIHYPLSRLDEGTYFGRLDIAAGRPLGETIDLDTFLLGDVEPCYESNGPQCFDVGYFRAWYDGYVGTIAARFAADGAFDVSPGLFEVSVDAAIPLLPVGDHGMWAQVLITDTAQPPATFRGFPLSCTSTGCEPLRIDDLPPGRYEVSLIVHNRHPYTEYADGSTFGGNQVAELATTIIEVATSRPPARAIIGDIVDGSAAEPGDRIRVDFWVRHRVRDGKVAGRFSFRVRGDDTLNVSAVTVDQLRAVSGGYQASGAGTTRDGQLVTWELTVLDGGGARDGVVGDRYRVRVVDRFDQTVRYDTQPGDPPDAEPKASPDRGFLRVNFDSVSSSR